MIDPKYYGLVELIVAGVIVLGLGGWQLWTVRHDLPWRKKGDSTRDPGHPEG